MTSVGSVASITKMIGEFSDLMTAGMKKKVRKHFREYLLGMMIPPEIMEVKNATGFRYIKYALISMKDAVNAKNHLLKLRVPFVALSIFSTMQFFYEGLTVGNSIFWVSMLM